MDTPIKQRWHIAYGQFRRGNRLYVSKLATACAKGNLSLGQYVQLKMTRYSQQKVLLHAVLHTHGVYALFLLEYLGREWLSDACDFDPAIFDNMGNSTLGACSEGSH